MKEPKMVGILYPGSTVFLSLKFLEEVLLADCVIIDRDFSARICPCETSDGASLKNYKTGDIGLIAINRVPRCLAIDTSDARPEPSSLTSPRPDPAV